MPPASSTSRGGIAPARAPGARRGSLLRRAQPSKPYPSRPALRRTLPARTRPLRAKIADRSSGRSRRHPALRNPYRHCSPPLGACADGGMTQAGHVIFYTAAGLS